MSKLEELEIEVKADLDDALEKTNELVSLMDDISPQVVIRGAKSCTFNIYPSVTKIYESRETADDEEKN